MADEVNAEVTANTGKVEIFDGGVRVKFGKSKSADFQEMVVVEIG